jgi:hypothetical protein
VDPSESLAAVFYALIFGNIVKVLMALTAFCSANCVDAHWITHRYASALFVIKKFVAFKALTGLRSNAGSTLAVMSIFKGTYRQTFSVVFREFITVRAYALVFQTTASFAFHVTSLRTFSVKHLVAWMTNASGFIIAFPMNA